MSFANKADHPKLQKRCVCSQTERVLKGEKTLESFSLSPACLLLLVFTYLLVVLVVLPQQTPSLFAFHANAQISSGDDARLLFTARTTASTEAAFVAGWLASFNIPSHRVNITFFSSPMSPQTSGTVKFFISGEPFSCAAMGRGMEAQQQQDNFAGSGGENLPLPQNNVAKRVMSPMSSFSIPSSWSIPESWYPTTTTIATVAPATTTSPPTTPTAVPTSSGSSMGSLPSTISSSGATSGSVDPCMPTGPNDMALYPWLDIQTRIVFSTSQDLYSLLNITEIWNNATVPNGDTSVSNWKFRLNAADVAAGVMYPRVGRVELQAGTNAMWGSVCMDSIMSEDVAVALCNTMYPGTTAAKPYYANGGSGLIALSGVHLQDGIVKGTLSSLTQPKGTCTHKSDLGLVCGANVTSPSPTKPAGMQSYFIFTNTALALPLVTSIPIAIEQATAGSIPAAMVNTTTEFVSLPSYLTAFKLNQPTSTVATSPVYSPFTLTDLEWIVQSTSPWAATSFGVLELDASGTGIMPSDLPEPPVVPVSEKTRTPTKSPTMSPRLAITTTATVPVVPPPLTTVINNNTATTSSSAALPNSTTTTPTTIVAPGTATTTTATTTNTPTSAPSPTTTAVPATFSVSFEVGINVTSASLTSGLYSIGLNQSDISKSQCAAASTSTNEAGVAVKTCTVDFTSQAAAGIALDAGQSGTIAEVYGATMESESPSDEDESDTGDNTLLIVAAIVVIIAVVSGAIVGVVVYKRRSIPQGEAFSLDDHFEMNESAMPLQAFTVDPKNELVDI